MSQVWGLLVAAGWGTFRLLALLSAGPDREGDWSFGQIIPVVMLLAPFVVFSDHITELSRILSRGMS